MPPESVEVLHVPCDQCPWRTENQGRRHSFGFYTKANLTRLWNQIRRGGQPQSCHPTDPSHPDHVACGAKPDSKPKECAGSGVLILREFRKMIGDDGTIGPESTDAYLRSRRRGLTRTGILYWLVSRYTMGGKPFFGGPKLPVVDENDKRIALPAYLEG